MDTREFNQLLTIREASDWATSFLGRDISESNIAYLVQYGKVKKYGNNGSSQIHISDLKMYYQSFNIKREVEWKKKIGNYPLTNYEKKTLQNTSTDYTHIKENLYRN